MRACGVVLAGGGSRRMGDTDKLLVEVGGRPLVCRVAGVLSGVCEEVVVAGPSRYGALCEVSAVGDLRPGGLGPLAGLEAGVFATGLEVCFAAAGDMPFLKQGLVALLLERLLETGADACLPFYGGRAHPLCGAYSRGVLPIVSGALERGELAVHAVLEKLEHVEYVGEELEEFGDPARLLMNVNSPRDLRLARAEVSS